MRILMLGNSFISTNNMPQKLLGAVMGPWLISWSTT